MCENNCLAIATLYTSYYRITVSVKCQLHVITMLLNVDLQFNVHNLVIKTTYIYIRYYDNYCALNYQVMYLCDLCMVVIFIPWHEVHAILGTLKMEKGNLQRAWLEVNIYTCMNFWIIITIIHSITSVAHFNTWLCKYKAMSVCVIIICWSCGVYITIVH